MIWPTRKCTFRFVAHGPILAEAPDWSRHVPRRDVVGGLEQQLERELRLAGWEVMNEVKGSFELDKQLWEEVRLAFREQFAI